MFIECGFLKCKCKEKGRETDSYFKNESKVAKLRGREKVSARENQSDY